MQASPCRVTTKHFVLLLAAGPDANAPARVGIVASRKVGGAVVRNRIKRVCREAFRTWPGWLPAGVDVVVIARAGAEALRTGEVRAEWEAVDRFVRKRAAEALARAADATHVSPRRVER